MNISPAHVDTARLGRAQSRPQDDSAAVRRADTNVSAERQQRVDDSLELRHQSGHGMSPAERIDAFAAHIHDRLAGYAQAEGVDVADATAQFDKHIARIQAGLADGTIDVDELGRALKNTMEYLKGALHVDETGGRDRDVDDGIDLVGQRGDGRVDIQPIEDGNDPDAVARAIEVVEGYSGKLEERLAHLLENADGSVAEGLSGALAKFQDNVGRILSGLEDGTLSPDQVGKALRNSVAYATESVQRAFGLTDDGDGDVDSGTSVAGGDERVDIQPIDDGTTAGPAETRFDAFKDQVLARLAGIDASGLTEDAQASLQALTDAFASSADRLGEAFFTDHTLSRHDFLAQFQQSFSDLKDDLSGLFGSDGASVHLYHPVTGVEELASSLTSKVDAQA